MTGRGVACRQTANAWSGDWLLMVVLSGSEVDHSPRTSGIMGQLPSTVEDAENWASFPGGAARCSAFAVGGSIAVVILQGSLMAARGGAVTRHKTARPSHSLKILPATFTLHPPWLKRELGFIEMPDFRQTDYTLVADLEVGWLIVGPLR